MTTHNKFKITVPATSANIGPGFDVLGIAYSLYLTLDCERLPAGSSLQMTYEGEGAKDVPLVAEKNLITKTALYVLSTYGITSLPPLKIHVTNPIPLGRGLGSSGSAVVAGVVLANAAGNLQMTNDRMLDYCLMVERHPDNVAPALFGGFVASFLRELEPEELDPPSIPRSEPTRNGAAQPPTPITDIGHYIQLGWTKEIKAIAVIPDFEVATEDARAVLPDMYQRADVVSCQPVYPIDPFFSDDPLTHRLFSYLGVQHFCRIGQKGAGMLDKERRFLFIFFFLLPSFLTKRQCNLNFSFLFVSLDL